MAVWFGHSSRAAKMSAWRNPDGADSLRGAADLVRVDVRFGHIRPGPDLSEPKMPGAPA